MIAPTPREHFGTAGHFCGSNQCRYHLHTHTNGYCVSTVGEYHPRSDETSQEPPTEIGWDRLYETMVFALAATGEHDGKDLFFLAANRRIDAHENHQVACDWAESQPAAAFVLAKAAITPEDHGIW